MKKRVANYYVSLKNVLIWLSLLCSICAAVGYVANVTWQKGTGVSGWDVCMRAVVPVLAALWFVLVVLLRGKDRIYRTSIPAWLLAASLIYAVFKLEMVWYWTVLLVLDALAGALLFSRLVSGRLKEWWAVLFVLFFGIVVILLLNRNAVRFPPVPEECIGFFPYVTSLLAFFLLVLALKKRPEDGTYYPTWGDRFDGRRVRSLTPMGRVAGYIMPDRNGASNLYKDAVEITALEKFVRRKKLEGWEGFGLTELFLSAYVRTVAAYPGINRFFSGQTVYTRGDDIQFCMVVKKRMSADAPDTIIKLHLKPTDTLKEVYLKFRTAVSGAQQSQELDSDFDGLAGLINAIPGVLLKFAIWLLKTLDYFALLPKVLLELSPFHGSVFFTSMGSLGIPAIYHHLYDFGNLPVFVAIGRKRRVNELGDNGEVLPRKYVDMAFVLDERTVDGFYYAAAIKHFQKLLLRPEQLEQPTEVKPEIP